MDSKGNSALNAALVALGLVAASVVVVVAIGSVRGRAKAASAKSKAKVPPFLGKQKAASSDPVASAPLTGSSGAAGSSSHAGTTAAVADSNNSAPLSREQLLGILTEVIRQMEPIMTRVASFEEELIRESQEKGHALPEEELRDRVLTEFKRSMRAMEAQVYSSHGATEEDVRATANYFSEDPDYKSLVNTLTLKFAMFSGQQPADDLPEHVTIDLIIDVMSETMEAMTSAMEDIFEQCKAIFPLGSEDFNRTLQTEYSNRVQEIRKRILESHGIDQELLQAGVLKYQFEPQFEETMTHVTTKQRDRFKKLGLA